MMAMNAIYFSPILKIKTERENVIHSGNQAANEATGKMSTLSEEYDAQLQEARKQAQLIIQEKREQAKHAASSKVSKARESVLQEIESNLAGLAEAKDRIYESLQPQREAFVKTIIDKLTVDQCQIAGPTH